MEQDELRVGDVMLAKFDKRRATHYVIATGQALLSHNMSGGRASIIHAAIYTGTSADGSSHLVAEASGGGLQEVPVHGAYGEIDGFGNYSQWLAARSLVTSSELGANERSDAASLGDGMWRDFYCSMFVVAAYSAAGATLDARPESTFRESWRYKLDQDPIRVDLENISPKKLQAVLKTDGRWRRQGNVAAA